jgi:hypothetical protein
MPRWSCRISDGSSPTVARVTSEPSSGKEVEAAVADFVDALDALSHELNGAAPSAAVSARADAVSREAAYAVAEVARMLREAGADREASAVDTGWLAVLARDIDDVRQHVAEEKAARRR